jgi:hypothetical protein
MFEIGKDYWIETGIADHPGTSVYTVTEMDLPLIKVENGGGVQIINTHSPLFHSAKPVTAQDLNIAN